MPVLGMTRLLTRIPIDLAASIEIEGREFPCRAIDFSKAGFVLAATLPWGLAEGMSGVLVCYLLNQVFRCGVQISYQTSDRAACRITAIDHFSLCLLAKALSQLLVDNTLVYDRFGVVDVFYSNGINIINTPVV